MKTAVLLICSLFSFNVVFSLNCNGKFDVVIAVPGSPQQVPQDEFERLENFLIDLVNYYEISITQTNVGLILYGASPEVISPLDSTLNKRQINTRISLLAQRQLYGNVYGGQHVPSAVDAIISVHSQSQRPEVPKVGVIMTYGSPDLSASSDSEVANNLREAAQRANDAGIQMFAVSTNGTVPGFPDLTSGDNCRLFSLGGYKGLPSLLPYLASSTCYVVDSTVNPSPDNCFPEVLPRRPQTGVMTCPPPDHGTFEDQTNCAYFIECTKTGRVRTRCAGGTLFDPIIRRCNHKEFVKCWSNLSCPRDIGLFPHPRFCNQYLNCYTSIPRPQSCPPGLVFNPKGYCDFPQNVNCLGKSISQ